MSVASSGLSTALFCRTVMLALPMSPLVLNLTPSLVTEMFTCRQQGRVMQARVWLCSGLEVAVQQG